MCNPDRVSAIYLRNSNSANAPARRFSVAHVSVTHVAVHPSTGFDDLPSPSTMFANNQTIVLHNFLKWSVPAVWRGRNEAEGTIDVEIPLSSPLEPIYLTLNANLFDVQRMPSDVTLLDTARSIFKDENITNIRSEFHYLEKLDKKNVTNDTLRMALFNGLRFSFDPRRASDAIPLLDTFHMESGLFGPDVRTICKKTVRYAPKTRARAVKKTIVKKKPCTTRCIQKGDRYFVPESLLPTDGGLTHIHKTYGPGWVTRVDNIERVGSKTLIRTRWENMTDKLRCFKWPPTKKELCESILITDPEVVRPIVAEPMPTLSMPPSPLSESTEPTIFDSPPSPPRYPSPPVPYTALDPYASDAKVTQRDCAYNMWVAASNKRILVLDAGWKATEHFKKRGIPDEHIVVINKDPNNMDPSDHPSVRLMVGDMTRIATHMSAGYFGAAWFDMTSTSIDLKRVSHVADRIMVNLNSRGHSPSEHLERLKEQGKACGLTVMQSGTYMGASQKLTNMVYAVFERRLHQ